jgi:hypothetical protein
MYRFKSRSLMSYRRALRTLPRSLRRQWLAMRLRFDEPRVDIGGWYQPPRRSGSLKEKRNGS